jgi:hypothetical protein
MKSTIISSTLIRLSCVCFILGSATAQAQSISKFESFEVPFSAQSLWNSKPANPVFDDFVIPTSSYFPAMQEGKYSTHCFLATAKDAPMQVKPPVGKKGIYDADAESSSEEITIPHWPADLVPAEGGDGHADIFDTTSGIIYSFWQLKKVDGVWRTTHVGWMPLNGSGWGDPAHYHQGSRASGVPSCAGIIRKHELNDGDDMYHHALAISLTNNALSPSPAYMFPATIADAGAKRNTGKIPEGALMMLPPDFDTSTISNAELRKVANTLKVYGAYVVDMNYGTPFLVYVEIGSGLRIHKNGWDNKAGQELHVIREGLRMVKSASSWIDGNGQTFTPNKNLNLLSMRGPWVPSNGKPLAKFVPTKQAVVFQNTDSPVIQTNYSDRTMPAVDWAKPQKGQRYTLKAVTSGGAKLRFKLIDKDTKKQAYDSQDLQNNETVTFDWPVDNFYPIVVVTSGVGDTSSARGILLRATDK